MYSIRVLRGIRVAGLGNKTYIPAIIPTYLAARVSDFLNAILHVSGVCCIVN